MKKIGHVIHDDVSFELVSVTLLFNGESNPNSGVAQVQRSYLKLLERRYQRACRGGLGNLGSSCSESALRPSKINLTGNGCLEIIRDIQKMAFIVPKLES